MIARTKLTEQRIADLPKPGQGASYTYDSLTPSLAIRVTAAGVRSFVVVKKINGKTQRITLGRFPGLRLDEARQGARRIAGEMAQGNDPVALLKAARARKVTLADLWPGYLAHLKQRNRTWARDKERWETSRIPGAGSKSSFGHQASRLPSAYRQARRQSPDRCKQSGIVSFCLFGFCGQNRPPAGQSGEGLD